MKRILPFFAIFTIARCGPVSSVGEVSLWKTVSECLESNNALLCAKEKALKVTDRLRSMKQLVLIDGIVLSNTEPSRTARSNDISSDPSTKEAQIEEKIIDNVEDLLDSVVLEFKMPGASDDVEEEGRAGREGFDIKKKGKGKKKDKGKEILGHILRTKLAALIPIFLAIIAITLVKKIIMAKIAFFVVGLVLLKKILSKKHEEPVIHTAHVSHGHGHGHGGGWEGWDRTKIDGQNLAYSGHIKS